jgi:hypothetical protein
VAAVKSSTNLAVVSETKSRQDIDILAKRRPLEKINFYIHPLFAVQRALIEIYESNRFDLEEIAPVSSNLPLPPRTRGVLARYR